MRARLADWLWRRRSRKGKFAVALTTAVVFLVVIGLAVPAETENPEPANAADMPALTKTSAAEVTPVVATTSAETPTETAPSGRPPAPRVMRVIDGDTLELDSGERVRLVQIDAPEAKGECYGRKAGQVLHALLPAGTAVDVARDHGLDGRDRYGRLLRYVYAGGRNINLALVQKGAASVWFYSGDRGRYASRLLEAATRAESLGRGAWGACDAKLDPTRAFQTRQKQVAPPPSEPQTKKCHPSYKGACLDVNASDYDCEGGSGDGPEYTGLVQVVGYDEYGLDADGDGYGCE